MMPSVAGRMNGGGGEGGAANLPFLPFLTRRLRASWHPDLAGI